MIFTDTGGFVALLREKDQHHTSAKNFLKKQTLLITTDYIVDETVTLILTRVGRKASEQFLQMVERSRFVRLEMIGEEAFKEATRIFLHHRDKSWSFTDCTSYAVMKRLKITRVFGFDSHFEQMGFSLVPGHAGKI